MAQRITLNNIDPTALSTISGPKITGIEYLGDDTATDTAGGKTVTLTGAGFQDGASVYVDGTIVSVVSVVSSTIISFTAPAKASGSYPLYVVNVDGGTATFLPGIQYSGTPSWATSSGSLGTVYEYQAVDFSLNATSDSTVSYSLTSGTLPSGASLSGNTISGTAGTVASNTTYNFTIDAIDSELQNTSRNFSIGVLADSITWSSPSVGTLISADVNTGITQVLSASAASGANVTYSANTLPSGLSIVADVITGNANVVATTTTLLTATSTLSGKTATRVIEFDIKSVIIAPGQVAYTSAGTYTWVAPAGVTMVSVVAVGGGGGSSRQGSGASAQGAGLGWKNNISVVPGQSYTVVVGAGGTKGASIGVPGNNGGNSYFISLSDVAGKGGTGANNSGPNGGYVGDGGGTGGWGQGNGASYSAGGGGAGGYTGNGGAGAAPGNGSTGQAGSGGGGGGGGSALSSFAGGGGGVGIYGQGANGAGGGYGSTLYSGKGGSGGGNGGGQNDGSGGLYGGGGAYNSNGGGAGGAVRIIWGTGRAFPATNTQDM